VVEFMSLAGSTGQLSFVVRRFFLVLPLITDIPTFLCALRSGMFRARIMITGQSKPPAWRNKRRVALVGLIAVLAAAIAVYLDAVEAIPLVVFPCLAWLMWKGLGVTAIGLAFWAASLELMSCALAIGARSEGNIFAVIPFTMLTFAALACILAAVITMLISAWRYRPLRRWNLLGAVLAPVAAVLLVCAVHPLFHGARHLRIARYFHENRATLQALIDDVDVISRRLGRVPRNEAELVALRKQPMPRIPWPQWGTHELSYHAIGERHFALVFGGIDAEGFYVYDSGTPERGWYHCWKPTWASAGRSAEESSRG
jgi:hypothetical protein